MLAGCTGRSDGLQAGWFVKPSLFSGAHYQMRIAREEIFGPVLTIIAYEDEADAIAIANDTVYDLSAMVLGQDTERCHRIARQIDAGCVLINMLAHEPKAPFGGFKHSGLGRELGKMGNGCLPRAQNPDGIAVNILIFGASGMVGQAVLREGL